jgi:hypothetical protein
MADESPLGKRPGEDDDVPWQDIHVAVFGRKLAGRMPNSEVLLEKFREFFGGEGNPSTPADLLEQWTEERKEAVETGNFLKVTPLQRKIDALGALPDLEVEEEEGGEDEEQVDATTGEGAFGPGLICHAVACPHCGASLSVSVTPHLSYEEEPTALSS